MKKSTFLEKYPVCTIEITKSEADNKTLLEIIDFLKEKIETHPVAKFITVFDNYAHTKSLNGEIMEGMIGAQNILFCFGPAIPNTKILAVRPRSIGICEFEDNFVVEFLEAPKEELTQTMVSWIKGLHK